ncbi:MAG: DUF3089 domain-containing protein [Bacteroidales bacterium]|nr:DUF3089 domain-containing protein [Bacteroidales bacterium]
MKNKLNILILIFFAIALNLSAQLDYTNMDNWAFHPDKPGTMMANYNTNIVVVNEFMEIDSIIFNINNSMTNTGIDVFFVHPTVLDGTFTTRRNTELHEQPEFYVLATIVGQAGLLCKFGRMFAPRYRQSTPLTYFGVNDEIQAEVIGETVKDIKAAFLHYLENHNNGNKIILAAHSQGAYITALMLRNLADSNPEIKDKIIIAALGGMWQIFAEKYDFTGGWMENIELCTENNQCGCILTWRCFKEGQTIDIANSPKISANQNLVDENYLYRTYNETNDWGLHDFLYYSEETNPLRYYILPSSQTPFAGTAGFVAYDSLYNIRLDRQADDRVGFMLDFNPKPNDLREDDLIGEEEHDLYDMWGYHRKDYNIYVWALMQQIEQRIDNCNPTKISDFEKARKSFIIYPNPATNQVFIDTDLIDYEIQIINLSGQILLSDRNTRKINISGLAEGVYLVRIKSRERVETIRLLVL